jgi:hypothetical protein
VARIAARARSMWGEGTENGGARHPTQSVESRVQPTRKIGGTFRHAGPGHSRHASVMGIALCRCMLVCDLMA